MHTEIKTEKDTITGRWWCNNDAPFKVYLHFPQVIISLLRLSVSRRFILVSSTNGFGLFSWRDYKSMRIKSMLLFILSFHGWIRFLNEIKEKCWCKKNKSRNNKHHALEIVGNDGKVRVWGGNRREGQRFMRWFSQSHALNLNSFLFN